jgi:hypothetical protein
LLLVQLDIKQNGVSPDVNGICDRYFFDLRIFNNKSSFAIDGEGVIWLLIETVPLSALRFNGTFAYRREGQDEHTYRCSQSWFPEQLPVFRGRTLSGQNRLSFLVSVHIQFSNR